MANKTIGSRLVEFAANYGGLAGLAEVFGADVTLFYTYTTPAERGKNPQRRPQGSTPSKRKKSTPGGDMLLKLWELGCDTNWLLHGIGEMWADNRQGRKLKKTFLSNQLKLKEPVAPHLRLVLPAGDRDSPSSDKPNVETGKTPRVVVDTTSPRDYETEVEKGEKRGGGAASTDTKPDYKK